MATVVTIKAPKIERAQFNIVGTAPLVVKRYDAKTIGDLEHGVIHGSTPAGKKRHEGRSLEAVYEAAKYIGETNGERWEGFNAAAIRNAMISACRLVNFKMTLAKMSIFVVEDGRDIYDPLVPLVRIYGEAKMSESVGRTRGINPQALLIVRPMYFPWSAKLTIEWDDDQFKAGDVANLLARAGQQVGIGEGRPDSKTSTGMGWGTFRLA